MGVGGELLHVVRVGVLALPDVCPRSEEQLEEDGGRLGVDFALEPLFQCLHSERHATEIGQVLSHRQVAVHLVLRAVLRVDVNVLLRLLLHQLRLCLEQLRVLLLPPVDYIAAIVKLAALVVISMSNLVRDYGADRSEVDCDEMLRPAVHIQAELYLVQLLVVEWRLEDRRREDDLVVQRVEVGVHLVRVHLPFGLVLRRVDLLVKFSLQLERRHLPAQLEDPVALGKAEPRMVLPLVRETDLGRELGELCEGLLLGGLGQPIVRLEASSHHVDHLADHRLQVHLVLERKEPLHVHLAEQLTGPRVDGADRSLLV
mmetsp:Transcript_18028/g.45094  ORF Transcript_18028/g.45094 Transcript_18028/m.45094 type:complete len:315 (+) Transcript_18028:464-1408(+)